MDLGKNIQQSIEIYKNNFATIFLASLVAGLVAGFTFMILLGPVFAGLSILILKIIRGEKGDFNEIFAHFNKFADTFIVALICVAVLIVVGILNFITLIPLIGQLICLAVGPVIGIVLTFSLILVIEQNIKPMDAIKQSIEYVKTNPVNLWLYALVMGIISGIGTIACGIGVYLTLPIGTIGLALAYEQLSGNKSTTVNNETTFNA